MRPPAFARAVQKEVAQRIEAGRGDVGIGGFEIRKAHRHQVRKLELPQGLMAGLAQAKHPKLGARAAVASTLGYMRALSKLRSASAL